MPLSLETHSSLGQCLTPTNQNAVCIYVYIYILGHFIDNFEITDVGGKDSAIVIWEDFTGMIIFVQSIILVPI